MDAAYLDKLNGKKYRGLLMRKMSDRPLEEGQLKLASWVL
jgi:hypothetical protein